MNVVPRRNCYFRGGSALLAAFLSFGWMFLLVCEAFSADGSHAAKRVEMGKNVTLEIQGKTRRVLVNAAVCMREGMLEQLLTRKGTKEHESVLYADVDARDIHKALLAAGAVQGSPVTFRPKYQPPSGTIIKVILRYEDKNKKMVEVPAQQWIRKFSDGKALTYDWVFAGSRFVADPKKKRPDFYLANSGDIICVSNFESSLLDLPIKSPKENVNLAFSANTQNIPRRGTAVTIILEPQLQSSPQEADAKKKK